MTGLNSGRHCFAFFYAELLLTSITGLLLCQLIAAITPSAQVGLRVRACVCVCVFACGEGGLLLGKKQRIAVCHVCQCVSVCHGEVLMMVFACVVVSVPYLIVAQHPPPSTLHHD